MGAHEISGEFALAYSIEERFSEICQVSVPFSAMWKKTGIFLRHEDSIFFETLLGMRRVFLLCKGLNSHSFLGVYILYLGSVLCGRHGSRAQCPEPQRTCELGSP